MRRIGLLARLETGSIKIALGPYPSVMSGYVAVGRLLARHPRLNVSMHVDNWRQVTRMVADKAVDVGVAELTDAVLDDTLHSELVGQHLGRYFCRPGHPILERRSATLIDLLQFPWATNRIPARIAAAFTRPPGAAGRIDPFNGEFVPAIEIDVAMKLGSLLAGTDAITVGSFTAVEAELEAGTLAVIPTPGLKFRASYGFIHLKGRAPSPATLAFMHEFREEDNRCAERERLFERRFLSGKERTS